MVTQFQHEPDQQTFQRTLLTLLQQIPLKVEIKPLVDQWSYFYERSIGCIGILKDWLVRALATGQSELLLERIQECALPIAQCESMALEAAAGEQELHYTASRQQHLWALLGMKRDQNMIREPVQPIQPISGEDVPPLPDEATPHQQKSRVGEQQPVRASGGRPARQRKYGELSFVWNCRGTSVGTDPSDRSGETPVSGVRSSQKGDNSGRVRHLSPSHAAAHSTCKQRPSVDQARDNLDQEVARSAVYAPGSFGMQERTSSQPPH